MVKSNHQPVIESIAQWPSVVYPRSDVGGIVFYLWAKQKHVEAFGVVSIYGYPLVLTNIAMDNGP